MKTKNVHLFIGNHEQMLLDYFDGGKTGRDWFRNGGEDTLEELNRLTETERDKILAYIRKRPYYKTISVNGRRYFLSHAGLNVDKPFKQQDWLEMTWSRDEFYARKALPKHICIFGHTQTYHLNPSRNCDVWFDRRHYDKINIDCGCAYGGALALLRLDDGKIFYVQPTFNRYFLNASSDNSIAEIFKEMHDK